MTGAGGEPGEKFEGPRSSPDRVGPIPEDTASDAEGLLDQGEKALLDGHYAKAREYFASAASLNPHDPRSRLSKSFSEFALGDFENAATTAREVMKIAPDLAATPLDMRGLFGEIGIIEKQLANLEQITQLHSKSSRMYFLLGFVRYFSGDRAAGAQTLLDYIAANPEDSTIRPFIEIAGSAAKPPSQPDKRSRAQPSQRPPSAGRVEAPRPQFQDRPSAPAEPPREYSDSPQGHPYRVEPSFSGPPNPPGRTTVVEPRHLDPEAAYPPAPESDKLAEIAVDLFCRAEGLDPIENEVVAEVTHEDFDEETGELEAEVEMHWVKWKYKEKHGRGVRKAKSKSETIELRFDESGRLIDYDD
ncbi:MAG TPA: hypothetical protein VJZ71_04235 [Phycisphaerae bacterium]|nr:hypothetical protein [Phycisphaerae bacterium]